MSDEQNVAQSTDVQLDPDFLAKVGAGPRELVRRHKLGQQLLHVLANEFAHFGHTVDMPSGSGRFQSI